MEKSEDTAYACAQTGRSWVAQSTGTERESDYVGPFSESQGLTSAFTFHGLEF